MSWVPPDVQANCQHYSTATVCQPATLIFLSLVTKLFGRSKDSSYPVSYPKPVSSPLPEWSVTPFDFSTTFLPASQPTFKLNPTVSSVFSSKAPFEDRPEAVYPPKPNFAKAPKGFEPYPTFDGFAADFPHVDDINPRGRPPVSHFRTFLSSPFGNTSFGSTLFNTDIDKSFDDTRQSILDAQNERQREFDRDYEREYDSDFGPRFNEFAGFGEESRIKKTRQKRQASKDEYDFIVVGGGSAGCVMANRLTEVKKWKVLLLEAGIEEPEVTDVPAFAPMLQRSNIDWNYRTQPEQHSCRARRDRGCGWARGKTMGGSSAINYMIYMRGNKRDYDEWEELGNHGWGYDHVLEYFKKSENNEDIEGKDEHYHGRGGYMNVERFPYLDDNVFVLTNAWKEKGLQITDFNAENQIGVMVLQHTALHGMRYSTNAAFIRPIRYKRENLVIRTQAHVTRLLIDPHTKAVMGVEYLKNNQLYNAYARKEVVLSAGALNSPKILMLSGIGPKHLLQTVNIKVVVDLPVGFNLQDHVTTDALVFALSNKTATTVSDQQRESEVYRYYNAKKKDGPLASTGALECNVFYQTKYEHSHDLPDIQYHFDGTSVQDYLAAPATANEDSVAALSFYDGITVRPCLLKPKSRGYMTLNQTHPVFGQPLIYPGYYTQEPDLQIMIASIRAAMKLESTTAFRKAGIRMVRYPLPACKQYKFDTDEYWACCLQEYTSTIFHPVGTCKMGPHWDATAVVDPELRVYGIKKLRVVDASIMPTIVRGNTNAPVIMIAEKASDFIKHDYYAH